MTVETRLARLGRDRTEVNVLSIGLVSYILHNILEASRDNDAYVGIDVDADTASNSLCQNIIVDTSIVCKEASRLDEAEIASSRIDEVVSCPFAI